MTNKPQSDMPETIYAEKTMSIGNKACGKWATKEAISDYLFSENTPKYISEQSHKAACEKEYLEGLKHGSGIAYEESRKEIAEQEAKHREEMLGVLDEIMDKWKKTEILTLNGARVTSDMELWGIISSIKQRIGDSHE